MKAINYFLTLLLIFTCFYDGQSQDQAIDYRLSWTHSVHLGDTVSIVVTVDISDGYYIYPPGYFDESGGAPTQLLFTSQKNNHLELIGTSKMFDATGHEIANRATGKGIKVIQLFKYQSESKKNHLVIEGDFTYQLCNEEFCHAPVSEPLTCKVLLRSKKENKKQPLKTKKT
ncbi:hypothetical protein [Sphingobacterium faecale]|uniref:Thiol:disulfide interchange protein DsbD N-terminal domain-containing protein n=1 Tax=Sphingobacterium faecale TaxID=2803775 RepID=A0ABS1RAY0_9SPHI|nr:hypothetical protein [Sphingobacterium faecale]MBL1410996.1 hypothetical protein [Sphingobacterium faecale]